MYRKRKNGSRNAEWKFKGISPRKTRKRHFQFKVMLLDTLSPFSTRIECLSCNQRRLSFKQTWVFSRHFLPGIISSKSVQFDFRCYSFYFNRQTDVETRGLFGRLHNNCVSVYFSWGIHRKFLLPIHTPWSSSFISEIITQVTTALTIASAAHLEFSKSAMVWSFVSHVRFQQQWHRGLVLLPCFLSDSSTASFTFHWTIARSCQVFSSWS